MKNESQTRRYRRYLGERRQFSYTNHIPERRSGKDRRTKNK